MGETDEEYRKRRYKELIGEKTWEAYDKEGSQSLEKRGVKGIGSGEALQIIEKELEERHHVPEGDEVSLSYYPSEPRKKQSFVPALKGTLREVGREIKETPARLVSDVSEEIRTRREVRDKKTRSYHEERRKRAPEEGRRKYELEQAEKKLEREFQRDLSKIKSKGRANIILAVERKRALSSISKPVSVSRSYGKGRAVFRQPTPHEIDPYELYSIRPVQNATSWITGRVGKASSANIFGVTGNPEAMYSLLGFNQPKPKTQSNKNHPEKSKSKAKRKRYNIFSGTWEEVE